MNLYSIQVGTGADGNLMPLKIFKNVFPKSTTEQLHTTKNNLVLKTYNNSNIEQLGI